ncbi:DNA repair protein RAD51 homolog 3 isoform X1 [Gymnodraco acuticeps]|uniref:DNA repair protein RAD51 homolog 3 n=1 Tax=Gymnodraco acuticeps TaxID=8218 RepID=A0A6P8W1M2_GYMAC|nr:DNA repair protein RAD51 homolog 3 isoform X1 [Gymnodraco acuticeps]
MLGNASGEEQMKMQISSCSLSPAVKSRLTAAGFHFLSELRGLSPSHICAEAGVSQQEALQVLQAVRGGASRRGGASGGGGVGGASVGPFPSLTALQLLQEEQSQRSIFSFCSQLDATLGGGLPVGKTTEICGAPGTGKTQLCLQLAVDVQVPVCFGGLGGQVVVVDTEGSFLLQRVQDIAGAVVKHCALLVEDDEQRVAMTTFSVETILSNIFLVMIGTEAMMSLGFSRDSDLSISPQVRCHDYVELLAELHLLPDFLSEHPRARLLVIDSVAFPFRLHFDELSQRTRLLNGLAQQLIAMATSHNVAMVITNQMTTRLRGGQSQLVPALGESWGHAPTIRLLLQWAGTQRLATIFKSPGHPGATVQYQITSDGFRDADQSEQPPSKRPRTHTVQSAAGQRDSNQSAVGQRDSNQSAAGQRDSNQSAAGQRDSNQSAAGQRDSNQSAAGQRHSNQSAAGQRECS